MTRREHYVPQFYLNSFMDVKGFVHIYDRVEARYFSCKSDDICVIKDLYETEWRNANERLGRFVSQNSIEDNYALAENDYADLVRKLLKVCIKDQNPNALICTGKDRKLLISFIVNLFVRNPWTLNQFDFEGTSDKLNGVKEFEVIRDLLEKMNFGSADSLFEAANKQAMLTEKFDGGFAVSLCKLLENDNYTFFFSEEDTFTTSSFPSNVGIDPYTTDENHMSAFLPLSPHVAVLFGNYENTVDVRNKLVHIDTDNGMLFNKAVFLKQPEQIRFIIGNSRRIVEKCVNAV